MNKPKNFLLKAILFSIFIYPFFRYSVKVCDLDIIVKTTFIVIDFLLIALFLFTSHTILMDVLKLK